jgi:hypothetical protein
MRHAREDFGPSLDCDCINHASSSSKVMQCVSLARWPFLIDSGEPLEQTSVRLPIKSRQIALPAFAELPWPLWMSSCSIGIAAMENA